MAAPDRPAAQCIVNGSFRRLNICWLSADCSILASECIGTVDSPERCCLHRSFVCPCRNRHQSGAFDVGNLLGKLRRFQIRAGSKVMNTHCVRQCYFRLLSICLNVRKLFKPVVQKICCLPVILRGAVAMKKNTDKPLSILLTEGDKGIPGALRKAGLSACTHVIVIITVRLNHLVMIGKHSGIRRHVGRLDLVLFRGDQFSKIFIIISRRRNQCEITRTGIMIVVRQTAWICKMAHRAAKLLRLLIHQVCKCTDRP